MTDTQAPPKIKVYASFTFDLFRKLFEPLVFLSHYKWGLPDHHALKYKFIFGKCPRLITKEMINLCEVLKHGQIFDIAPNQLPLMTGPLKVYHAKIILDKMGDK